MNLNDIRDIQAFDTGRVAESVAFLAEQMRDAIKQSAKVKIPASYKKATKIVVAGMGGSNLGARIIASVFKEELKVPFIIEAGYTVPGFVDKNTLYILSSYSGTTEEPLSTYAEAKRRRAKIVGISSSLAGSRIAKIMAEDRVPGLIFEPAANPSGQPRLGLGYAIFGLLALLEKSGFLKISRAEKERVAKDLSVGNRRLDLDAGEKTNEAKVCAQKIHGRQVVLAGAEFLEGSLHALRNQFNESSKNFASYLVVPDMNHYALESLANPEGNKDNLLFLFFDSALYDPREQKRCQATKEVVKKNKIEVLEYRLAGKTKLAAAAEMLQFGSWLTFYLAVLNGVDPVKIPWVDWFKEQLK